MATSRKSRACAKRMPDVIYPPPATRRWKNAAHLSLNLGGSAHSLGAHASAPARVLHENFLPHRLHRGEKSTSLRDGQHQEATMLTLQTALVDAGVLAPRADKWFVRDLRTHAP